MNDRAQKVEGKGSYSYWRLVTNRVTETSNLGNLAFNVFINGLEKAVECTVISFGDDTKFRRPISMLDSRAATQDRLKEPYEFQQDQI